MRASGKFSAVAICSKQGCFGGRGCVTSVSRRAAVRLFFILLTALFPCHLLATAPIKEIRRVLVFNDLNNNSSPGFALTDQAIFDGLEKSPYQIELYTENLETTLFPDEESQREFRDWYVHKYQHRKPDVIIAAGRASIKFMADSHEKAFPGIPVIFCGSTEGTLEQPILDSHFTGVWAVARPDKTLDLALQLKPNTKRVVVVGGVGAFDRDIAAMVKESLTKYESKLEFTYFTDLDMPTLLERLRHLPGDSIVFHTSIMEDAAGAHFIDATQSVPMVAAAANAPVFILDDVDLGNGPVGGDLLSWAATGRLAAEMAVRVLNGEKPEDIPIVKSPGVYMFDWRALKRWGLQEKNLPPGSIVVNREPTVWELYKWYIVGGVSLILIQTLLIAGLLWHRRRLKKAENELAIIYDRFRVAVQAGKSVGWDWDVKSGRDEWFGDLQTIFGIPAETHSGKVEDFRRRVHEDDRELVWKSISAARKNRQPYIAEFRVHRDDGTTCWITARGKFYYASNGDAERMLGIAVDITDRKEMEQRLHQSQERLGAVVQSAMDAILAVDEKHRIVLFNPAAEKMFGCTTEEAMGTNVWRFLPEGLSSQRSKQIRLVGKGDVTSRSSGTVESLWALRANGHAFPIEASFSQIETDGNKLLTVIVRDVTERRRAEQILRESEERFRLVANTAPVMIWMSGIDKLCNYFNQPWLEFTGRPLESELGNGWADGVHRDDFDTCFRTYSEAFDRREPFRMQYRLRRYDGDYRWVSDIGVPRFDPDGSFAGYIGSCIDVTEQKLAGEALATIGRKLIEAHEEERTWIGRELHDDINQRLALLAVELDNWNQHPPPKSEFHQYVQTAKQRITDLGKDVQALSHRLHSSKLDYLGLASAASSFCREMAEQRRVEIDFSQSGVPRNLPKEISLSLFRVLQESVQNALKYSGVGHFKVELTGTSTEVQLIVNDLGAGFDQQDMVNHRGLGLISMRERLQMVGGQFSVTSEPGRGTTIWARVPLRLEEQRESMAG